MPSRASDTVCVPDHAHPAKPSYEEDSLVGSHGAPWWLDAEKDKAAARLAGGDTGGGTGSRAAWKLIQMFAMFRIFAVCCSDCNYNRSI